MDEENCSQFSNVVWDWNRSPAYQRNVSSAVYEDVRSTTGRPVVESVGFILGAKPDSFQSPSIAFRFSGLR